MDATLLGKKSPPNIYPNPTRYFIFNCFIISLICIEENAFLMRYDIWKEREKVWQKAGSNSVWLRQKTHGLPSTPLKPTWNKHLFSVLTILITHWKRS